MNIIDSIDRFINSRMYHYALLINGKWGSGKTYFVKNTLIPHIKMTFNLDVNYISFYGIKSTDEISQMLCLQAMKDKTFGIAKHVLDSKGGQITTKVLSAVFRGGMNIIGAGDTGIESVIQSIPDFDNNVIIFDDLERCGCPINEVLGYINDFVEHSYASVILVANEDEIGKWQLNRNPEMQTLIAMDSRVNVDLQTTMKDIIKNRRQQERKKEILFTPEEIEYRRQAIFHSNERYNTIKEKVIGLTINYEPNLKQVFTNLIKDNINNDSLKELLLTELDWLVLTAVRDEHKNFRTFQYFLEKLSMIYESIEDHNLTINKSLIRYTYRSSIRYMKGKKMPDWDGDYGQQAFGEEKINSLDREFGFKFIDDLIVMNTIDADYMNEVLTRFNRLVEKRGQLNNDPSQLIKNWWTSEDEQIVEWLNMIEDNIKKGVYSTELYTELLRYLAELKAYNIKPKKCDCILIAMENHIKSTDPSDLEPLDRERFILDGETAKIYRSMSKEIATLLDAANKQSEKKKYEDAISNEDNWASKLVMASSNAGNLIGHSFIYWLDPETILSRIEGSNNFELHEFRNALLCVYGENVYYKNQKDDYEHLKSLQEGVQLMDTYDWGDVKKVYQKWIFYDIGRYLEKIKSVD